jgi:uncharacterized membrane protein YkoI
MKVKVNLNDEDRVINMEPLNKATGKTAETKVMTARLLTQAEIDRETKELMQEGIHTYRREHGRVKQNK